LKLPDGRDRVVRHGHGPQRAIQTGVGPVEVRRAKVRDRGEVGAEEKIRFTSSPAVTARLTAEWQADTQQLPPAMVASATVPLDACDPAQATECGADR
jgi:hypothetical protein